MKNLQAFQSKLPFLIAGCLVCLFSQPIFSQDKQNENREIVVATRISVPDGGSFRSGSGIKFVHSPRPTSKDLVAKALATKAPEDQLCSLREIDGNKTYDVVYHGESVQMTVNAKGSLEITRHVAYSISDISQLEKERPADAEQLHALKLTAEKLGCVDLKFTLPQVVKFDSLEALQAGSAELRAIHEYCVKAEKERSRSHVMCVTPRFIIPEEEEELLGVEIKRP
jgi:hypothetical protein